jgi:hypothetical protein
MRWARGLLVVAVFGAVFYLAWRFAMDNSGVVIIKTPMLQDVEILLWIALLAAFALGAVLAGLVAAYQIARLGMLARRYRKVIRRLEAEVHQLRNLPLTNDEPAFQSPAAGPEESPTPSPSPRRALGRGA